MVRAQRRDPLSRPAVAIACYQAVAIQHSSDDVISGNQNKLADRGDDVGRCAVALTTSPFGQTYLAMNAAGPMHHQDDFRRRIVDVGDDLVDDGSHDALFQPCISGWRGPDAFEIGSQMSQDRRIGDSRPVGKPSGSRMGGDFRFDLRHLLQRDVPAFFQFSRHQPVGRIGCVILPSRPVGGIACRLEIAPKRVADLIPPPGGILSGRNRRSDSAGADNGEQCLFDGVIDP